MLDRIDRMDRIIFIPSVAGKPPTRHRGLRGAVETHHVRAQD